MKSESNTNQILPIGTIGTEVAPGVSHCAGGEDETKKGIQHSNIGHPEKSFFDKIFSFVGGFVVPFHKLYDFSSDISEEGSSTEMKMKIVEELRQRVNFSMLVGYERCLKSYEKMVFNENNQISAFSTTVHFPRNHDILSSFLDKEGAEEIMRLSVESQNKEEFVETIITGPSSAIVADMSKESTTKEKHIGDLTFSEDTEFILWFHGGGLMFGCAKGDRGVTYLEKISSLVMGRNKNDQQTNRKIPNFVLICVEYRLAPENPFPAAVIDGLSTLDVLVDKFPNNSIHIGGISGGGNLSAVIGMEAIRKKYPSGNIKSILIDIPMLNPYLDTTSAHENEHCAYACPVQWLRWCWAAYLQLECTKMEKKKENNVIDFRDDLQYQNFVSNSRWSTLSSSSQAQVWRLIDPTKFLPDFPTDNDDAPKIIIHTQTADVLRDDGRNLFERLHKSYKASSHFETKGSHVFSHITGEADIVLEEWSKSFEA